MTQYKSQIQNLFLSMCRKKHQPCEVVLNTGTTLRGKLKSYDQFSITLSFKDKIEVIYKSAILFITAMQRKPRPIAAPRRPYGMSTGPSAGPRRTPSDRPVRPPTPRTPPGYDDSGDISDPPPPRKSPRS